jgi:hypothetical protein
MMKRLILLGLLLWAAPASAAYDAVSSANGSGSTACSTTHVTGSGSNRVLVAAVAATGTSNPGSISATYNGVSMTAGGHYEASAPSVTTFYLLAPASGSHTLSISWSNALSFYTCAAVSWDDVAQSAPYAGGGPAGSSSGVVSVSTDTSGHDNSVLFGFISRGSASGAITTGGGDTGSTIRISGTAGGDVIAIADQGFKTPTGTYVVGTADANTGSFDVMIGMAFEQAGGGGGGSPQASCLTLLGVSCGQ